MHIVHFASATDPKPTDNQDLDWPSLVELLSTHLRLPAKDQAPGFGLYTLSGTRKDENVQAIHAAVFDVDHDATPEHVADCRALLARADLPCHWYTTYSHTQDKPSWRLVIPFDQPWSPTREQWDRFRKAMIHKFRIPADPDKCGGRSHFYYRPSCPPDGTPEVFTVFEGTPLVPTQHTAKVHIPSPELVAKVDAALSRYLAPEPQAQVDLAPLKRSLRAKVKRLAKTNARKSQWLERCLDGQPLDTHGNRNNATLITAGVIAFALPEQHYSTLFRIMLPSVAAMQAQGSRITNAQVQRMLLSAQSHWARERAEEQALLETWREAASKWEAA